MILNRYLAALMALALLPSHALAQSANGANAPAGYATLNAPCVMASDGRCYAIGPANGLPVVSAAASSTACSVVATGSSVSPTGCGVTGGAGNYVAGPFTPQPGYAVRLVATGTWAGSIAVGTSVDGCATINALTAGGQGWGNYTANANENVDTPATTGGIKYCLSITITSGTLRAALRQ